jgi:predicted nuclease of predicted toxin-antitoxin system
VKFLVDAQLPRRLIHCLRGAGYDALHVLELPQGYHWTDNEISAFSLQEDRIVVSKDDDFVDSFLLLHLPRKLLLISGVTFGTPNSNHYFSVPLRISRLPLLRMILLN